MYIRHDANERRVGFFRSLVVRLEVRLRCCLYPLRLICHWNSSLPAREIRRVEQDHGAAGAKDAEDEGQASLATAA